VRRGSGFRRAGEFVSIEWLTLACGCGIV